MDSETEDRIAMAKKTVEDMNRHLVKKGRIHLEVLVTTEEQAEQIFKWMYNNDESPMNAELVTVSWDKVLVSKEVAEAVQRIQEDPHG